MSNETTLTIHTCPACSKDTPTLTKRTWTHYDHDSEWAYDDGEVVKGLYCDDCLSDIDRIEQTQAELANAEEMTEDEWRELACRLAIGLSGAYSNWQDAFRVTKREMYALTQQMGTDWQRRW